MEGNAPSLPPNLELLLMGCNVEPLVYTGHMKTTLQRWGNSQGVRIPKQIIERIGIAVGNEVKVSLSDDQSTITIAPIRDTRPVRGRHRIEDLIAASQPDSFVGKEVWRDAQGNEVW